MKTRLNTLGDTPSITYYIGHGNFGSQFYLDACLYVRVSVRRGFRKKHRTPRKCMPRDNRNLNEIHRGSSDRSVSVFCACFGCIHLIIYHIRVCMGMLTIWSTTYV